VNDLVNELKSTYYPNRAIDIQLNIPRESLDVDTTLPLGLMINEMVSNAFKYAYADIDKPLLKVELIQQEMNGLKLIVADNGKGVAQGFDINQVTSFGMKLIKMLSKQLSGELKVINEKGLSYELSFSNKKR